MVRRVVEHDAVVIRGAVTGLKQALRQSLKNERVFISSAGSPLTAMFVMNAQMNGRRHHGEGMMLFDLIS